MAVGTGASDRPGPSAGARFPASLLHTAATLYYLQDATQAEVAAALGTSRATVSRLLQEARTRGIVRIEVIDPARADTTELAEELRVRLGLTSVRICASAPAGHVADAVSPVLAELLGEVGLGRDDVMIVSSGRTMHDVARRPLPSLPGVVVAPMVGGQDEPEPWYQTNEITRRVAAGLGGVPRFLFAPAMPGPELRRGLMTDPSIRRVFELWADAKVALMGVGAPPLLRASIPGFVPTGEAPLRRSVGDVSSRFYDADGVEVTYEGGERLIACPLEILRDKEIGIAVAYGAEKVPSILGGVRGRYFTHLVTDPETAGLLLAEAPPAD
ncbi:sugar-binding transcriptional regulator [Kineococcus gynurae]|uniref:Sugar-binding transcriptional regulator n=1 Tax=Kineococcus gynurae TaxID=452979 RepID=A0ABV5LPR3_9ACTN